jgi:radical SAM superfamily enzyme YgiQ (UPF0313 family)
VRILVVSLRYAARPGLFYNFPLGLAYISSALKRAGHQVFCLNLNHVEGTATERVKSRINYFSPQVLCTGGLSPDYQGVSEVLSAAEDVPGLLTIIGGGLLSSEPEIVMKMTGADFGIIGEGEITVVELVNALEDESDPLLVEGLIARASNHELVRTARRPVVGELDHLPMPDFEGFGLRTYMNYQMPNDTYYHYPFNQPREVPIIGSRSCPFNCTFCYHPLGNNYRIRSLDSIFNEIDYLVDNFGANIITFYDELFAKEKNRLVAFCQGMKKRGLLWRVSLRVDFVDDEILALIKDSGCYFIGYGLESAHDRILKSMNKGITIKMIEKALEATWRHGIGILGNFIFGDKDENLETVRHTMNWWRKHKKYQINLSYVISYPGTMLYQHALKTKVISDKAEFIKQGCPPANVSNMSAAEYDAMVHMVLDGRKEQFIPGHLIKCENTGQHPERMVAIFSIEAQCPHCKHINRYDNIHHNMGVHYDASEYLKISCKNCNQRYDLPSIIHHDIAATVAGYEPGRLCIIGIGPETQHLVAAAKLGPKQIACIIDIEKDFHAKKIEGIPIETAPDNFEFIHRRFDCAILTIRQPTPALDHFINELSRAGVTIHRPFSV